MKIQFKSLKKITESDLIVYNLHISCSTLKGNVTYVIIGHSERGERVKWVRNTVLNIFSLHLHMDSNVLYKQRVLFTLYIVLCIPVCFPLIIEIYIDCTQPKENKRYRSYRGI